VDGFGKGNGPRSTPLVAGGRVFTLGPEGLLLGLDLETGKEVWRRALHQDYEVRPGFFGVGTSPVLTGDLLLVNVGGKGAGIVAFHKDTGKEVWKATDDDASYASPVVVNLGGERSAVFFTREGLVVLDPATGKVRFKKHWRSRINASVNAASPVVAGDDIFLTACYGTGAVLLQLANDGVRDVWKNDDSLSCHFCTPIQAGGFLYGFDGRQEEGTSLRCVEMKTGRVRWSQAGFPCGPMIAADGHLIILSETGDLVLVEMTPAGYKEKARATVLTSPCRANLALANGRLYARDDKKLVCWNLKR
jgi:outer membrane protein assembly factor BamB